MKIYYAHSIRGNHSEGERTPDQIIPYLQNLGHNVLSEEIFVKSETRLTDQEIFSRDVEMIRNSDLVLANVTNPSLGVGYELGYGELLGKRVICFYQQEITKSISAMVNGNPAFCVAGINAIEELAQLLQV